MRRSAAQDMLCERVRSEYDGLAALFKKVGKSSYDWDAVSKRLTCFAVTSNELSGL
jgi:hypothetical protein